MDHKPAIQGGIAIASLTSLFKAFLILAKAMGWLDLTNDKTQALIDFFDIAFPIIVTAITMWWVSRRSTPLENAKDKDGMKLVREDTHGPTLIENKKSLERSIRR